ncbi:MAG: hypothetical protein LBG88_04445 [Christensenellaceae bacterium]|nr:hypothetical protein [Christensenellaceae bacterium]
MDEHNRRADRSGEEIIATAGAIATALARTMDDKELADLCELLGLVRHNLDIIRFRRHHIK